MLGAKFGENYKKEPRRTGAHPKTISTDADIRFWASCGRLRCPFGQNTAQNCQNDTPPGGEPCPVAAGMSLGELKSATVEFDFVKLVKFEEGSNYSKDVAKV